MSTPKKIFAIIIISLLSMQLASCSDDGTDLTAATDKKDKKDKKEQSDTKKDTATPDYVGEWDVNGQIVTVTKESWNGLPIVATGDGYVIVKLTQGGGRYVRIDWIEDKPGHTLYYCYSETSMTIDSLKGEMGPDRSNPKVGGCYGPASPWQAGPMSLGIAGDWVTDGASGTTEILSITNDTFMGNTVDKYTNEPGIVFVEGPDAGKYSRFLWYKVNPATFKGCYDLENDEKAELNNPATIDKTSDTGCNGKSWKTYHKYNDLAFNAQLPNSWKKADGSALKVTASNYDTNDISIVASYDDAMHPIQYLVTKQGDKYGLIAYQKKTWREAYVCAVNKNKASIGESQVIEAGTLTESLTDGCKGAAWTPLYQSFMIDATEGTKKVKRDLVGYWQPSTDVLGDLRKYPTINYMIDGKWLNSDPIIAYKEDATTSQGKVYHTYTYVDASNETKTKYVKTIIKYNDISEEKQKTESLNYCDVEGDSLQEVMQPATCLTPKRAYRSWAFSGFYSSPTPGNKYLLTANLIGAYDLSGTLDDAKSFNILYYANPQTAGSIDSRTNDKVSNVNIQSVTVPPPPMSPHFYQRIYKASDTAGEINYCDALDGGSHYDTNVRDKYVEVNGDCNGQPWESLKFIPVTGKWSTTLGGESVITANQWEVGETINRFYDIDQNWVVLPNYDRGATTPNNYTVRLFTTPLENSDGEYYFYACDSDPVTTDAEITTATGVAIPATVKEGDACPSGVTGWSGNGTWVKYTRPK